jgi:hypothetical protein
MTSRIRFRAATALLLLGALATAGCDEEARELAGQAKKVLDQRSQQLSKKIAAEKAAYNASATLAARDHRELVDATLRNERNERADVLAADYVEGRKPVSLWRRDVAEYARIDYTANRELLTADLDESSRYLQTYADLIVEQDKVQALSKLLAALAKEPSLKQDIQALTTFAGDAKEDFDKKVCTALKAKTDSASKSAYKTKKCDDVLK